tara:strand:+ start:99 stop:272 length:174 start_codon:yes stop_codon:yes gene_type:complete
VEVKNERRGKNSRIEQQKMPGVLEDVLLALKGRMITITMQEKGTLTHVGSDGRHVEK